MKILEIKYEILKFRALTLSNFVVFNLVNYPFCLGVNEKMAPPLQRSPRAQRASSSAAMPGFSIFNVDPTLFEKVVAKVFNFVNVFFLFQENFSFNSKLTSDSSGHVGMRLSAFESAGIHLSASKLSITCILRSQLSTFSGM